MSKEKWYVAGLNFTCTQCGNCCSGPPGRVWVTKEEQRKIAEFIGHEDGKLTSKHVRRVGLKHSLTEKEGGDCTFLKREDGKAMCSIYPVRPLQCRTWPFWGDVLRTPDSWNATATTCPGMNTGQRYDFVQIETRRTQKKW